MRYDVDIIRRHYSARRRAVIELTSTALLALALVLERTALAAGLLEGMSRLFRPDWCLALPSVLKTGHDERPAGGIRCSAGTLRLSCQHLSR